MSSGFRLARGEAHPQLRRDLLEQIPIGRAEGGAFVAVNVDFAEHHATVDDRNDDLRLCLEAAFEIAGIADHIVHDDGRGFRGGRAADPAAKWDTHVR